MKLKITTLLLLGVAVVSNMHAQGFLKKIKEKATGKTETTSAKENSNDKTVESNKPKTYWCDTGIEYRWRK
jgi:hypothetical protein